MSVTTEMDLKVGARPIIKVQITTSGGTTDISAYLKNMGSFDIEKSRLGEQALVAAGDMMFVLSNHDDKFTERVATSVFYSTDYIGYAIDIDYGFRKDDGTTEYVDQAVFKVMEIYLSSDSSECYIIGRDNIEHLNKFTLSVPANAQVPTTTGNTGNGYVTEIQTKPFGAVTENWTLTCTTLGGSGVGIFSVVGSVSGNIGSATSNTAFSTGSMIQFTLYAGTTPWAVGDTFTFSTVKGIEFTATNPAKIIWALLTGYNYDADTTEDWLKKTPQLDSTQSAANTDIDFASFTTAVTNLGATFNLTGYAATNTNCASMISDILIHFLGSIYADEIGKITLKTYAPTLGAACPRIFSDSKKISSLKYLRSYESIVNSATAKYKKTASWAWSGEVETTDGTYTKTNAASIATYGEKTKSIDTYWLSVSNAAIQWAIDRIVDKYASPVLTLEFVTGSDGILLALGDIIQITDTKTLLSQQAMEVFNIGKDFTAKPTHITVGCDDTGTTGWNWGFCGSNIAETDHDWSVAASQSFDTATDLEKQYAYASQTGGEGTPPDYYAN